MLEAHTMLSLSDGLVLSKFEDAGEEYSQLSKLLLKLNELLLETNAVISKTYFKTYALSQQQLFVTRGLIIALCCIALNIPPLIRITKLCRFAITWLCWRPVIPLRKYAAPSHLIYYL